MANRRGGKRRCKRIPLTYSSNGLEFSGITANLSETGVFIRTRKPFSPGVPVELSLETGGPKKLKLSGVTAWSVRTGHKAFGNGMGVRLTWIPFDYVVLLKSMEACPDNKSFHLGPVSL